ncbi:hypothetical protein D479_07936 [Halobacillus sp. BAB-2008]|nr:hypothetical protein D479_07936 [Halobacillus sp. BAB-2008]
MVHTPLPRVKKVILSIFAITFVLFITGIIILYNLGSGFLFIEDSEDVQPADALIVLSGESNRLPYAVDLFNQGLADSIILTNSTEKGVTREDAENLGVPSDAIIEETKAESTLDNAVLSEEIMFKYDFTSAIVVTSDYHSRRTKMTFDKIYEDSIELSYAFAPSFFDASDGLNEREQKMTFSEYVKYIAYSVRLLTY